MSYMRKNGKNNPFKQDMLPLTTKTNISTTSIKLFWDKKKTFEFSKSYFFLQRRLVRKEMTVPISLGITDKIPRITSG